ncbi:hypothetical protein ACODT5_07710 [Streptomyces sp. 5.8]|uniref:hypothetical protein n=1 Tax=Streptomyces sp. 5.8 TaxID=3406571 RepID=UPI003BB71E4F
MGTKDAPSSLEDSISGNAADSLTEAFSSIGIDLPSIHSARSTEGRLYVDLGSCSPAVAYQLAHWIQDHQ